MAKEHKNCECGNDCECSQKETKRDPVHKHEDKWYFYNEIGSERLGPFDTENDAREELKHYIEHLNALPQVTAYPAKDPNGNLIAVFEHDDYECPNCKHKRKYQLIINSGTIFQFAALFQQAINKELAEKNIITPEDMSKSKGRIIIPEK